MNFNDFRCHSCSGQTKKNKKQYQYKTFLLIASYSRWSLKKNTRQKKTQPAVKNPFFISMVKKQAVKSNLSLNTGTDLFNTYFSNFLRRRRQTPSLPDMCLSFIRGFAKSGHCSVLHVQRLKLCEVTNVPHHKPHSWRD